MADVQLIEAIRKIFAILILIISLGIIVYGLLISVGLFMLLTQDFWKAIIPGLLFFGILCLWLWLKVFVGESNDYDESNEDVETASDELHYDEYDRYTGRTIENKHYDKYGRFTGQTIENKHYDEYGSYTGQTIGNKHYDKYGSYTGESIGGREYDRNGKYKGGNIEDK